MATDKRIIKTKTSIKTAFMQLMINMNKDKITVSDIAAKAMINRSTFYLHYADVPAVMQDIEHEIAERISACIDRFDVTDVYGSTYSIFTNLTAMLDENEIIKNYIVFSTDSTNIVGRLKEIFAGKAMNYILKSFPLIKRQDIEYPITYAASGIVYSYAKWVKEGDKDISLDELIRETSRLTSCIISIF